MSVLRGAGFPPDMSEVTRALQKKFVDLREMGEARQTPVYFWSRDWQGNENGLGRPEQATGQRTMGPRRPSFQVSVEKRRRLVDAFCLLPAFLRGEERERVLEQISPSIVAMIPRSSKPKFDIDGIVGTCLSFPDGICELMGTVSFFYEDVEAMKNLESVFSRHFPSECEAGS
jgi:hypothetical protein